MLRPSLRLARRAARSEAKRLVDAGYGFIGFEGLDVVGLFPHVSRFTPKRRLPKSMREPVVIVAFTDEEG